MRYDDAQAWATGPELVYRRLAAAAIDRLPQPLTGATVVDAGAGTGAAAHQLRQRGALTLAVDLSASMLALAPPPAVVGDICRLPLRTGAADACVACLVLSHVTRPQEALAELARVARSAVVATAFPVGAGHPVKEAADRVFAAFGYRAPDWYTEIKESGEKRVGENGALAAMAREVGLAAEVAEVQVSLDGLEAKALAGWRLGMAPVAAWLSTLEPTMAGRVGEETVAAVGKVAVTPLSLLVLAGRVQ